MPNTLYHNYAPNDEDAAQRADKWRKRDPFPKIPPALLSAEHIREYVKQTGMVHPFHPEIEGRLKAASYEILVGGALVRWQKGVKIVSKIDDKSDIVLPANSITFMQTECKFRLPEYIALRFNLRIQHVHRGLLLGTGPLIDPGFGGKDGGELLIPVHNLTATDYVLPPKAGFIWVEFTKTSREIDLDTGDTKTSEFSLPSGAPDRPLWFYFEKANRNMPIESSIPLEIESAKESAKKSALSAKKAERANKVFAGIGFIAVLGAAIGLLSFLSSANGRVDSFAKTAAETKYSVDLLKQEVDQQKNITNQAVDELRRRLDEVQKSMRSR